MTLVLFSAPNRAHAFCRTTTTRMPPSFEGCAQLGVPLFWRNACVWTTAKILNDGDPTGGYATFACTR